MTTDGHRKGDLGRGGDLRMMGSEATMPVRYVRDRLRETEKVIRSFRSDLDYYRTQNSELVKERGNLLKLLSQKQALDDEQSRLAGDLRLLKTERDRLEDSVGLLGDENRELKERCSRLEAVLVEEQERHAETLDVIVYLEAQIEQLESMVKMLIEHRLQPLGKQ